MRFLYTMALWLAMTGLAYAENHLLVFTGNWCGPCQKFKQDLAEDPELISNIPVELFDIEIARMIADDFAVTKVPTFILIDVQDDTIRASNEIRRDVGYTGPRRFKKWLNR
jgi:thiol-disulfide isomerase/thioredoxin